MNAKNRLVSMDIVKIQWDHSYANVKKDMNLLMMALAVWIKTNALMVRMNVAIIV